MLYGRDFTTVSSEWSRLLQMLHNYTGAASVAAMMALELESKAGVVVVLVVKNLSVASSLK